MQNVISRNTSKLILQAERAGQGLIANAEPLGLVLVSPGVFDLNLKNLIAARDAHAMARGTLRQKRTVLGGRVKRTRRFGMRAREILKDVLGFYYSEAWQDAGYEGSLAVPRSIAGVVRMMHGLKGYLHAHPEHETGDLTAARASTILTELLEAISAVDQQLSDVRELMSARDAMLAVVRKDLQALTAELWVKADPTGPVWENFGLKRPGILQLPDAPEAVVANVIGPRAVRVRWKRPARGRSYRVWRKIVGVDQDWVLVGTRRELDLTIENLPAGVTVEIAVSALNNGGESSKSTVAAVVTDNTQAHSQTASSVSSTMSNTESVLPAATASEPSSCLNASALGTVGGPLSKIDLPPARSGLESTGDGNAGENHAPIPA